MQHVFVHFLEEIEDTKKTFKNQLTFNLIVCVLAILSRYLFKNQCFDISQTILRFKNVLHKLKTSKGKSNLGRLEIEF